MLLHKIHTKNKVNMNDILNEFNSILEKIIAYSVEVNNLIKDLENKTDNIDSVNIAESIDNIYKDRNILAEKLKLIFNEYENKEKLLNGNLMWIKYNEEILPIENQNIDFLNKKSIETKDKLTKLSTNKSLLIYNNKVKLSYENKLV